jgi:molybdopterin molybdotransferase
MDIEIQLTSEPIAERISAPASLGAHGAWLEFRGVVRGEENDAMISALEYEAYPGMAESEIRRALESLAARFPCLAAKIIHRTGIIPVGDTAIYVGIAAAHRGEAIALLAGFMDRLKQDVPIWKRKAIEAAGAPAASGSQKNPFHQAPIQIAEALAEITLQVQPLTAVRVPLSDAFGRTLREMVAAATDLPDCDRSTRDGYAILQNDNSSGFQVVDTLHAADWKPRQLKPGEAVRIATGAALPCDHLRVVMQENVERDGNNLKITKHSPDLNLRKRGEDVQAGQTILPGGACLDAGALSLLASVGAVQPLVNPRLRVIHFTTGDELVSPEETPKPGQIRNSNSILIRSLLQKYPCELAHRHLPENFEQAKAAITSLPFRTGGADLVLVSGGASVGEKDFTRELLAWLGFEIIFHRVNLRPGAPLIFGVNANRVAFGLPGNPLSHFVCFHLFVAATLARFSGAEPRKFTARRLAEKLSDASSPRETLWPGRLDVMGLHPLPWSSAGDVTCLPRTNALIRVPANRATIEAGDEVEFLPV